MRYLLILVENRFNLRFLSDAFAHFKSAKALLMHRLHAETTCHF
jgi:hypothetical protein